ncbi:unnamed protein product, partial [Pleuronectes platessa]
ISKTSLIRLTQYPMYYVYLLDLMPVSITRYHNHLTGPQSPTQQPGESALFKLLKAEMVTRRRRPLSGGGGRLNRHDSSITSMEGVMSELKREIGKLKDRNDDLENRSRRQNLRNHRDPEAQKTANHGIHGLIFSRGVGEEIPSPLVLTALTRTWLRNPNPAIAPTP